MPLSYVPNKPNIIQHFNPSFLFATSALIVCPSRELRIFFVGLWNLGSLLFLLVCNETLIHFQPSAGTTRTPSKPDRVQKVDTILVFAALALIVYPSSEFGIHFVGLWNLGGVVFLLVGNETPVHFVPTIRSCIPFKTNSVQKADTMFLFATSALGKYPYSVLGIFFNFLGTRVVLCSVF